MKKLMRSLLLSLGLLTVAPASFAGVSVFVSIAPPPLPVYVQPEAPDDGYIWTPGYWAYDDGYYWVPGAWVLAPRPGYLWTPGYWGWRDSYYHWNAGYWGPSVGFYGGVNYGFGYFGIGYQGGYWDRGRFYYNRHCNNINVRRVHYHYDRAISDRSRGNRISYNGGRGGLSARPDRHDRDRRNDRGWGGAADRAVRERNGHDDRDGRHDRDGRADNRDGWNRRDGDNQGQRGSVKPGRQEHGRVIPSRPSTDSSPRPGKAPDRGERQRGPERDSAGGWPQASRKPNLENRGNDNRSNDNRGNDRRQADRLTDSRRGGEVRGREGNRESNRQDAAPRGAERGAEPRGRPPRAEGWSQQAQARAPRGRDQQQQHGRREDRGGWR